MVNVKKKTVKQKLTKVYVVAEYDPPEGEHTWQLIELPVASASDKMIIIARTHSALGHRTRFSPSALGRLFHEAPARAVTHFIERQNRAIDVATRAIMEAKRVIAWVENEFKPFLNGTSDELIVTKVRADG